MSGQEDEAEKSHEPTQKKLDDARRRGELPRSVDVTTAAAYGGFLIAAVAAGSTSMTRIGEILSSVIDQSHQLGPLFFEGSGVALTGGLLLGLAGGLTPWFVIPALTALLAILAQRSFVVAPEKLEPKISRISPIQNAKQKYGMNGLFEFAKSATKLLIYSAVLAVYISFRLPEILATLKFQPGQVTEVLFRLATEFMFLVLVIAVVIGAIDFVWQQAEHLRRNRMSHKELRDENKEQEGDPIFKQARRQKAYDIATNKMLADVPKADVVVVNPTHYAVALTWSRKPGSAPVCVAKGVDEIALRIREVAMEAGVPIHSDPPSARAMHQELRIGEEIHPEHYEAVAAAIRFAEGIRQKAKARRGWV